MGKPACKRPLGRPWHRWKDNIKVIFKVIGWEVHMKTVINLLVTQNVRNFSTACRTISFSRRILKHGVNLLANTLPRFLTW